MTNNDIEPLRRYYSQHGEDYLLWKFFDFKKDGFFVEVGAFDGVHLSNTYSFELEGWKGICVEPGQYFENCKKNRPNSLCVNAACVSNDDIKEITFYEEELGLLSSLDMSTEKKEDIEKRYENRKLDFSGHKEKTVKAQTLNSILEENSVSKIDFVTIDVEGAEIEVLKGFDLKKYKPKVVILEANDIEHKKELMYYMTVENGYIFVREVSVNLIFVSSDNYFKKMRNIEINCTIEKQLHPLGLKHTITDYLYGLKYFNNNNITTVLKKKNQELEQKQKVIEQKNNELKEKNQELDQKQKVIEKKNSELKEKNQELDQKQKVIEQKNNELKEKNQELEQKQKVIEQKNNELKEKNQELEQKQKVIEQKNNELKEKNQELEQKQKVIEQKNNELKEKNQELEQKQKVIEQKNNELKEKNQELDQKQKVIEKKNSELKEKNQELEQKQKVIEQKNNELKEKNQELDQKQKVIEQKNNELKEKNQELEQKQKVIEQKNNELKEKNQELEQKQKVIEQKNNELKEKNQELEQKQKVIEQKNNELKEKNQELDQKQKVINKLELIYEKQNYKYSCLMDSLQNISTVSVKTNPIEKYKQYKNLLYLYHELKGN
jgi:FkbM family methyltransferase